MKPPLASGHQWLLGIKMIFSTKGIFLCFPISEDGILQERNFLCSSQHVCKGQHFPFHVAYVESATHLHPTLYPHSLILLVCLFVSLSMYLYLSFILFPLYLSL